MVDIVRDKAGTPTYAVVAIDNDTTAVPYDNGLSMVRGDKVVMRQAKLAGERAAREADRSGWTRTSSKWRTESDRYWGNTRTAEPRQHAEGEEAPADALGLRSVRAGWR